MTSVSEAHKNSAIAPLPYENENDMRETVENFSAYLAILREWDSKERMKRARSILDSASPGE